MNAADVLADVWPTVDGADDFVAALLAHGEHGVAILPDGTLWALDCFDRASSPDGDNLYRLVPISAEPGDFPGSASEVARLTAEVERLRGLLLDFGDWSAEAGDTDG